MTREAWGDLSPQNQELFEAILCEMRQKKLQVWTVVDLSRAATQSLGIPPEMVYGLLRGEIPLEEHLRDKTGSALRMIARAGLGYKMELMLTLKHRESEPVDLQELAAMPVWVPAVVVDNPIYLPAAPAVMPPAQSATLPKPPKAAASPLPPKIYEKPEFTPIAEDPQYKRPGSDEIGLEGIAMEGPPPVGIQDLNPRETRAVSTKNDRGETKYPGNEIVTFNGIPMSLPPKAATTSREKAPTDSTGEEQKRTRRLIKDYVPFAQRGVVPAKPVAPPPPKSEKKGSDDITSAAVKPLQGLFLLLRWPLDTLQRDYPELFALIHGEQPTVPASTMRSFSRFLINSPTLHRALPGMDHRNQTPESWLALGKKAADAYTMLGGTNLAAVVEGHWDAILPAYANEAEPGIKAACVSRRGIS